MLKKLLIVFGTRPEAIKMAPLIKNLQREPDFSVKICVTGQHREMLDSVLAAFDIHPDYDLAVMKSDQTLSYLTNAICAGVDRVISELEPNTVMVHGDTTTAFATSLAAFYRGIPIAHIEAGLRSGDMSSPFPEEFNRRAVSLMASINFAPTERAKVNLLREGVSEETVFVTGNTVIDALSMTEALASSLVLPDDPYMLMTVHRRERTDSDICSIFRGVRRICLEHKELKIIYPVHKSPRLLRLSAQILDDVPNIIMTPPLPLADFHNALRNCLLVLTDSGGVQEEASYLGKPVLVARDNTERPEGTACGTLQLIGTDEASVYKKISELLTNKEAYLRASVPCTDFGDGHSSKRICDILKKL